MPKTPKDFSATWYFNVVGKVREYDDLTKAKMLKVIHTMVTELPKGERITITVHRHK